MKILVQTDEKCGRCNGRGYCIDDSDLRHSFRNLCGPCMATGHKLEWVELGAAILDCPLPRQESDDVPSGFIHGTIDQPNKPWVAHRELRPQQDVREIIRGNNKPYDQPPSPDSTYNHPKPSL